MKHFHGTFKEVCDRHDPAFYPKFKKWCAGLLPAARAPRARVFAVVCVCGGGPCNRAQHHTCTPTPTPTPGTSKVRRVLPVQHPPPTPVACTRAYHEDGETENAVLPQLLLDDGRQHEALAQHTNEHVGVGVQRVVVHASFCGARLHDREVALVLPQRVGGASTSTNDGLGGGDAPAAQRQTVDSSSKWGGVTTNV